MMFQGINSIAQIIIATIGGLALLIILVIIYQRGFRAGAGKIGIDIPGLKDNQCANIQISELESVIDIIFESLKDLVNLNDSKRLERKMVYTENKLVLVRGLKEKLYYKLLKDSGVDQDRLTSHVDSQYYMQVLNNALFYDNGQQCMKTLFRRALRSDDYADNPELSQSENANRYEKYIGLFLESSMQKWKRFFYDNYKTNTIDADGKKRVRKVTNEDIYDMDFDTNHMQEIKVIYHEIFDNAKIVDEQINKEQVRLYTSRKENIRRLLSIAK